MSRLALAMKIQPGKEEAWSKFADQLAGPRYAEFVASRRRLRVREVTFHQETSEANLVVVTLEGTFVAWSLLNMSAGQDSFTVWFVEQLLDITGVDLRNPEGELPVEIIDSGALTDDSKKVVRRFLQEVLNAHDAGAAPEIFAATYRFHFPGRPESLDLSEARKLWQELFTAFPDLHVDVGSLFAEDYLLATRVTLSGTHLGPFCGLPPTGRRFSVSGLPQWRVADGQIVEDWAGIDLFALLEQLGAVRPVELGVT